MAAELFELEKLKIDVSDIPEEYNLRAVELGLSGCAKVIKNDNTVKKILPSSTLPIGLPPVYPELKDEIEELLTTPKDLPIHAFQNSQRFWQREQNIESLYEACVLPCPTELQMVRDLQTGKLDGMNEVLNSEIGLTAHNSMSMQRKPGAYTDSVKGESMNRPFWPGGMEVPSLDHLINTQQTDADLEVLSLEKENYLVSAPGFDFNVTFERKAAGTDPPAKTEEDDRTINIADILLGDLDLSHLYVDVTEKEATEKEDKESPVDISYSTKEEIPDHVLQIKPDSVEEPKKAEIEAKSWSILDNNTDVKEFHRTIPDMAFKYPFELDTFQKRAVLHLEKHENVLVAAHTSAGKTVVAEYAIALSQKHMRRAIYTSPIKALSNQKFRDFKGTFPEVGLLTGDVQIKPESSCLIMTTEILRSMLYNGSDVIRDVEWVIFDEIHYINDADRGVVWEEVLIMLPAHIGIILLSATVPNTLEFASWIGKTKQKEVYVVQTTKRPVPLEHYLFTGNSNKTSNELFCILDRKGKFVTEGYRAALYAKKERSSKSNESYGPKGARQGNPKQDKNVWNSVVHMLKKKEQLPCVAFTLSKRKCDSNADMVRNIDLVTSTEQSHITSFFKRSIGKLKGSDQKLPQVLWLSEILKNGIGVHHSGILPILKEVVEMLFQRGLVKILFATETFAMGVNMPARTVVFDSTRKFDGVSMRELLSSEYIQMAGRAGRRGLDTTGMVILLCKGDVPETSDLHKMMMGTPTKLTSQFRLTYYMILNLLRVKQLTVQDMMKRSFAEYYLQRDSPENVKKLEELRVEVKTLRDPDCCVCSVDLKEYYLTWVQVYQLKKEIKTVILSSLNGQKSLVAGRVIVITNNNHNNALAVILQQKGLDSLSKFASSDSKDPLTKIFTVLVLCSKAYEEQKQLGNLSENNHILKAKGGFEDTKSKALFQPEGQCGQVVEEIIAADIDELVNKTLKIDCEKVIDNYKKRLIPRFRFDPPAQSTIMAGQDLLNLTYTYSSSEIPLLHPMKNLNITTMEFVQNYQVFTTLKANLNTFSCLQCSNFAQHFSRMRANMVVKEEVSKMEHHLSDESLELLQEYNQRLEVLKKLNYIDADKNLRHKGRVAFEMSTHEVMITELLINNVLTDLDPIEVVSILSCFVFEMKKVSPPTLTDNLKKARDTVKQTAERVAICQKECGLDISIDEFVGELHFGLVEVIYEWARGMSFKDIMNLTDCSEGNIVRCIQRLDEVCRDVRKAAHVIGVQTLCDKMERGMSLIRRDIVFAASLYTS